MAISDLDRKLLWGKSGFRCAICRIRLSADATQVDRESLLGEECHIVAQSPEGPRGGAREGVEIDSYANLILLCRNHHKMIDDQENTYTAELLRTLKAGHEAFVETILSQSVDVATVEVPAETERDIAYGSTVILDTFPKPAFLPQGPAGEEIFAWRLSDAFPGKRGLVEIVDARAALDRLDVILRHPIEQLGHNTDGTTYAHHPFFWFRGTRTMHVERYSRLDAVRCVINFEQMLIARVAAFRSSHPARQFLYIETLAEPPIGIYEYEEGEIERRFPWGYYYDEEYALWNERVISLNDYEDRATVIDDKPVAVRGAEPRTRYLTPYNLLLSSRGLVINDSKYDDRFGKLMDGILRGDASLEELCDAVSRLPLLPRWETDWA